MRTYEAQCRLCGFFTEYRRHVKDCMDTPECPRCEYKMEKVIHTAPRGYVKGKWDPFKSIVDGSAIRTERELAEHNKRNNVASMAEGYTTEQLMRLQGTPPPRDPVKPGDVIEAYRAIQGGYKPQLETEV
jgi:hypothetical protein